MTIRRRLIIAGRVQGVFFRNSCQNVAEREQVSGSARNLADGRVEVVLEGPPDNVEAIIAWCHDGPAAASVDGVQMSEEAPEGMTGFSVE